MSVDLCNDLHPTDLDIMLHSKTIFWDIAPYIFWNRNQMSSTVSSYLFANWKARRITTFVNWLTEKCIRHETIVGHTPQQNGVIERDHRTTGEAERSAMLNMKNLPKELWAESYNCAVPYITQVSPVYVQNMSTSNIGHIICFLIFHSEYYFGMFDRLRKNTEPLRC